MKLTDILREMDDQDGLKSVKGSREFVLRTETTPLSVVEDALNDINNYGQYIANKQNVSPDVKKIINAYFGPSGVGPKTKNKITREIWDQADTSWRKFKLKDIKSRHPEVNIDGLEDLNFEALPEEIRDPRVYFISPYTKDKLDTLIKSIAGNADILYWYEDNNTLVFPRDKNENLPGDVTIDKIVKTVMKNAGIKDAITGKEQDVDGEKVFKSVSKTTQMSVPVESRAEAASLRKELQAKFEIPAAGYKIKEDENGISLSITGITITQKANITYYLKNKGLLEESDWEMRKMLVLAGIIK